MGCSGFQDLLYFDGAQQTPRDQFAGLHMGGAQERLGLLAEHGHRLGVGPGAAPAQAGKKTPRIVRGQRDTGVAGQEGLGRLQAGQALVLGQGLEGLERAPGRDRRLAQPDEPPGDGLKFLGGCPGPRIVSEAQEEAALLLPLDPDASAARLREAIAARAGVAPAVVASATLPPWARSSPWRHTRLRSSTQELQCSGLIARSSGVSRAGCTWISVTPGRSPRNAAMARSRSLTLRPVFRTLRT